jgi:hypothetical protein
MVVRGPAPDSAGVWARKLAIWVRETTESAENRQLRLSSSFRVSGGFGAPEVAQPGPKRPNSARRGGVGAADGAPLAGQIEVLDRHQVEGSGARLGGDGEGERSAKPPVRGARFSGYGVPAWTCAMAWLAVVAVLTARTARRGLPFSTAWWGFVFPVGTVVTGTSRLAARGGSTPLTVAAVALFLMLLTLWALTAARALGAASPALR